MNNSYRGSFLALAIVACSAATAFATDGPFGVKMGADPKDFGCNSSKVAGYFHCTSVPKPHSSFESYVIYAAPGVGACMVKGIGTDVRTSGNGFDLKIAMEAISHQIEKIYGKPELIDYLNHGSIWDEPREWLTAIKLNERGYGYTWEVSPVKDNNVTKAGVFAKVSETPSNRGYFVAEFYFSNEKTCDDVLAKQQSSAFE